MLVFKCRHVLNNRSDHCRARHDSGMRDAADAQLHVPEHFSKVGVYDQDLAAISSTHDLLRVMPTLRSRFRLICVT